MSWFSNAILHNDTKFPDMMEKDFVIREFEKMKSDPAIMKKVQETIDSSPDLVQKLKWVIERFLIRNLKDNDKSHATAYMLQIYWRDCLSLPFEIVWKPDSVYWKKTKYVEWLFRTKFGLEILAEKEKSVETLVETIKIGKNWKISVTDALTWVTRELDIKELFDSPESKERIDTFSKKLWQMTLLVEASKAYYEYLQSLHENISLKRFSDKPEKYEAQMNVIKEEIRSLNSKIGSFLNSDPTSIFKISEMDIGQSTADVFVSERTLVNPILAFLDNIVKKPEIANKRFVEIRNLIIFWNGPDDKFDSVSVSEKKIKIFSLLRENDLDGLDDDKHRYNSSEGIRRWLEPDILSHEKLRSDADIRSNFDSVVKIKQDRELIKKLLDNSSSVEWIKWFLISISIKLNGAELDHLSKNLYNDLQIVKDQVKEFKNKNPGKDDYELKELALLISSDLLSRRIIYASLESKTSLVKALEKWDKAIWMYADIEWVCWHMADAKYNKGVSIAYFVATQMLMMYASWWLQMFAWNLFAETLWLSRALTTWNLLTRTALGVPKTIIEWTAFYWSYTMLDWLMDNKNMSEILEKYNIKDAWKMILFLSLIKIFSHTLRWFEKFTDTKIYKPVEFMLETWALLWADVTIRFISHDWLPKNREDLQKFLRNDGLFIMMYLLSLKWLEKWRVTTPWIIDKIKNKISKETFDIKFWAKGEAIIEHKTADLKKEDIIADKRRRVNNLEQLRNIARNKKDKKEVKRLNKELIIAREDLKKAKELPDHINTASNRGNPKIPIVKNENANKNRIENEQTSNVNHTVNLRKSLLDLGDKKLWDALAWFDKLKLEKSVLGYDFWKFLEGEFWKLPKLAEIREKVYNVAESEVNNYIWSLSWEKPLNKSELQMIENFKNRIADEFTEALTLRMQWKSLEIKYWDSVKVEKMMGMFVEKVNPEIVKTITINPDIRPLINIPRK